MSLVSDLVQALLIPLYTWELQAFGTAFAFPVTPLSLVLAILCVDRVARLWLRRTRKNVAAANPGDEFAGALWPTKS